MISVKDFRRGLLPLAGIWAAFALSRVFYDRAGVQFQWDTYLSYWQFMDVEWLRGDLWRSVFYLHSQPPLLNLTTGLILQGFPESHRAVFHILYFVLGLTLSASIYLLGLCLRLSPWLSALISIWFIVSPAAVLYEHWLMYAYPLAAALCWAGVCLYQFAMTKRTVWGAAFFFLLAIMALTWSLFHIIWLYAAAVLLFVLLRRDFQKTLTAALLPLLLTTGWYGKNLVLYGEFTASSWAGMNLSKIVTSRVPQETLKRMIKAGELSPLAMIPSFRNPLVYLKFFPETPLTGVPLLDAPETSLNSRNHHHLVYLEASRHYLKDAVHLAVVMPSFYLRSAGQAFYIYFHSASDFDLIGGNRKHIKTFDLWWNRIFYGQWRSGETSIERNVSVSAAHFGWWIAAGFLFTAIAGAQFLWRNRMRLSEPQVLLILFMTYNVFFVTLVGNTMDIGENNRFRFVIDPFIPLLSAFLLRKPKTAYIKAA